MNYKDKIGWIKENKGKSTAFFISIFYLFLSFSYSPERGFKMLIFLMLPLASIFFSEEMGNYTGWAGMFRPRINEPSPAFLVRILGWILLFLPVGMYLIAKYGVGK